VLGGADRVTVVDGLSCCSEAARLRSVAAAAAETALPAS
jgi:hypothetical protein